MAAAVLGYRLGRISKNFLERGCVIEKSLWCLGATSGIRCHTPPQNRCYSSGDGGETTYDDCLRVRGIDLLRDPRLNKGMAFTLKERMLMGFHGLLPPAVFDQSTQTARILENLRSLPTNLDKYIYLVSMQDRNEKLFYKVLSENIKELAPIVYTPTVGQACQRFGLIYRRPRGLYITINDIGHVHSILCNWPEKDVKAIVVTDGERILGLGDLGAFGMGIPIGKLALYTAMGGVPPNQCLPVVLDVGTDNDTLLDYEMYIGLRHKRVRGDRYLQLIDEFLEAVVKRFGRSTVVQFEDFANHNAFRLLDRYRHNYVTFNDDIQGTASVVVAGITAATRVTKLKLSEQTYLFLGAGEAAIGVANQLLMAIKGEGLTQEEAASRIWLIDVHGLLVKDREVGPLSEQQKLYAKDHPPMNSLEEIVHVVKPNIALGAAAATGAFTPKFLRSMAEYNERPIIFALSNPTSKAECTAEEAYIHTEGRCIFASGSPFDPVTYEGKTYYPGQGNNAYIFPGLALGAIVSGVHRISHFMFQQASQALAAMVTDEDLESGSLYPPLQNIREVSTQLAAHIVEHAYKVGMASTYPEPEDKVAFVRKHQYSLEYHSFVPPAYPWPGQQI